MELWDYKKEIKKVDDLIHDQQTSTEENVKKRWRNVRKQIRLDGEKYQVCRVMLGTQKMKVSLHEWKRLKVVKYLSFKTAVWHLEMLT